MGSYPSPLEQPLQRRVQRAVIDQKLIVGLLLEKPRNPICVIRSGLQTPKYYYLKGALQQFESLPLIVYPLIIYRRHTTYYQWMLARRQPSKSQNIETLFSSQFAGRRWKRVRLYEL